MTLLEYITSLQDTGLSQEEIFAKAQEFKGRTKPAEVEVNETPSEKVKTEVVVEKDATAATTPEASESSSSGSGQLPYQDDYSLKLSPTQGLSDKTGGFGSPEFYDEVFNNIALNEYEEKKEQYEKELSKYNKIKKSQEEGLDLLESGEVNFASRVIIPRGEFGYDEYTIEQVNEAIKNKEEGFEDVIDVQDYVSKVPGAEIITYTENMDFEGAVGTLEEVDIKKYNSPRLNEVMQNSVWAEDPNNLQTLNNNLKKLGNNYFFTADKEKEAEKEKSDGSKAINIQNAQAYRTNYLGNQASIEHPGITVNDILESGKSFLTEKELEFTGLSLEEKNRVADEENYGEALFFGDNLINLDLDNIPESQLELFEKSNELASTTEVEVLEKSLSKDYFKLIGLAKEIYNWDLDSSGAGNDPLYFTEKFANQKGFEWTNDIRNTVKEIAKTGRLPKNLSALDVRFMSDSDGHPLIKAFNDTLKDYKAVNRAILLNRDPLTTEQDGFWSSFGKSTGKMLGIDVDTNFEKQEDFLRWSQANGFTASKSAKENDLFVSLPNNTFGLEQSFAGEFGAGTPELLKWMGEIYLFTRGTGNIVAKSQKWLNKAASSSKKLAKIPYALPAFKGATSVLAQSVNFTGGTLVSQYLDGEFNLEELQSSAGFGASLAAGHVAYDPFVAYLRKSKFGKFFSPAVDRLTKYAPNTYKRVSKSVGGGFAGATTYQLGGVISQGGLRDSEGNITVSLRTQALETMKMITAGVFTKAIPNFQTIKKEFKSDVINARNSGRLDLESKNSAAALGIDKESITNVDENSLKNLNNAFNKKVDDLLKRKREGTITKEAADAEFKELKNNYRVVDTQIAVNAAYKMIKAEEASGNAPKQSEFYTVSGKIKNGEKLTDRDGEVLSYYGLDGVGMLYKRLGIQKNSANDQYLQSLILNESLIDAQLNGKSFILTPYGLQPINPTEFVTPKGSKARAKTREFLRKRLELDTQIYKLKKLDTKNLSESELLKHKNSINKKQEELKEYVEGGKLYDNIQSEIQGSAITAYEKDIKQVDPSKGKVIEESTPDSFQKRYDESGFAEKDVKQTIAFTDKEGNKVINREFALEVRDFTPLTHEIPHSILKDSFKDAEGNVTAEGVEMIDGVLSKLTPVQTKTLKQELASRYDIDPKNKELWYEENITVLAELMKRGEITFTKSLGEGLAGLVPAFKKLLPNIEVDAETGKGIFEMLKAQDLSRVNITETETKDKSKVKAAKLSKTKAQDLAVKSKSKEGLTRKEEDELVEQVQLMAIEALGYKQGKGTVSRDKALGFVNDYIPGILRRFKPVKNIDGKDVVQQLSTFVYRNIQPKQAKFYEQEIGTKSVETSISDERQKELESIEDTSRGPAIEVDTDVKLVDNIKIDGKPLDIPFKDKVRGFVTEQLKNVDINSEKFRKQVFKPSKAFVDFIVKDLIGNPKQFREFLNSNPTFYKGLSITDLVAIDDGRVKKGQPRLFTEPNRRLTKQADIEKFMMQGRIPYLTTTQQKAGAVLYNRLNPKVAAVINNFFGSTPQNNSNRKRAIAKAIANKFIAEATPSTESFQAKSQLDKAKIAERLQVSQEAKFSKAKTQRLKWRQTDEALVASFKVGDRTYKTTLEETAFMEFDEGQTYRDIESIAKDLDILKDAEGDPIESSENFYHLEFGDTKLGKGITGKGNAFEVFTTTMNGVVDYLKANPRIEGVVFTAKEPSRIRLYKTLSQVLAGKLNGSSGFKNDTFIVSTKPSPTAKFSESKKTKAELKRIKFNNEKENKSGSAALDFVVKAEALADFRTNTEAKAEAMINAAAIAAKKLGAFGVDKFFMPGNWTPGTKLSTVFRGGFNVISDVNKIKDPKAKKEALDMIANKELVDLADIIRKSKKDVEVLEKEFIEAFKVAAGAKSGVQARKNAERKDLHDKGVSQTIDIELEMFLESEIGEALVREMLHNSKLNKNLNRNQALPTSYEDGTVINGKRKEDTVDEHQYQAIEHAQTKIKLFKAIKNAKGEKQEEVARLALDFYKKWIAKNYTQFLLKNETDIISGNLKNSKGEVWNKSGSNSHPLLKQKINDFIDLANKKGTTKEQLEKAFNEIPSADIRYFSDFGYVNPNFINTFSKDGSSRTKAQQYGVEVDNKWKKNPYVIIQQGKIIEAQILTKAGILKGTEAVDGKKAKELMKVVIELAPGESKAAKLANEILPEQIKYNEPIPVEKGINALAKTDKALANGRKLNAPVKKIRVLDFDDTVGVTKSNVLYTMPDGRTGKIDAATFAKEAGRMEAEGAEWDFSEFSKVMEGKKGPLFEVMKTIFDKRGGKDLFILTARPSDAAGPIKEFLESLGVNIPIENITGLGDGTPQAKAGWIMGKAAEGYNDFYFADDHLGNVKAVKDVLSQLDVKSKVQQAKFSKAKTFDTVVNDMIEDSSGIEAYKKYSAARAKTVGASKGKYNFLIPASAEDFTGLLYKMLGKGKKGDAQMAFLKTNLLDTYNRAESAVTQAKVSAANDFVALKTKLKTLPKTLSKETGIGKFTYSHAVRVAAWTKQGMDIPGLSKRDIKELNDFVNKDAKLRVFTDELIKIQKGKEYPAPGKDWLGGNITTDIIGGINKVNRAEYQQEWRENIDIIFSEDNMNKMEAAYGTRWREAMEDSIRRMKAGTNRPIGGNRVTEGLLDWLNNSVGAVMFLNTRSALLQTISAVNFINLGDNNIIKAGRAFANQKQFWGDFMTLMNSDYLVERRNGLKINVSESEIADAVRESKNKPKAAIAFLLSKGFVMTRFADSFAIASGGSTFYRNRLEALKKQGLSDADAAQQAFEDFKAIAEENQQSSSPSKISQQQASAAGRVILAWANTPMQYARIQKRAAQDLINKRGDWKSNVSKIVYYGAIQNLIFNSLQQAVFALGFGDDEEETDEAKAKKRNDKAYKVVNGMIDSQLKGLGIFGAASVAIKNTLTTLYEEHGKKGSKYENAIDDLLGFSPPLGSKIGKIKGGLRSASWNKKDIKEKGFSLDNPAYMAGAQVVTGLTNVPLDRVAKKINNLRGLVNERSSLWQKVALGLGWGTWELGLGYYGGWDKKEPLTPKQELQLEVDKMKKDTNKPDQVKTLLDFGLTKKQIRELKNENNRVKKILELQKKDKDAGSKK